jgi:hypothetical protein
MNTNEITINGVKYVPADSVPVMAEPVDDMRFCIIRTYSAGVHAGYVKEHNGKEVTLVNSRRLWKWSGAFTLSEMAVKGVAKPAECKFATTVPELILTEAIEIIPCTESAKNIILGVKDYDC